MSEWIDVSVPLRSRMVHWPGDIPVSIEQTMDLDRGDACNLRTISMSAHTGTHMDAPLHFVSGGESIDQMPLDAAVGPARVIAIANEALVTAGELEAHRPRPGERLLLKTANGARCWQNGRCFLKKFVHLNAEAACFLVNSGIRTLGVDYLSVGAYGGDGAETHRILLEAGIWIVEGLDLSRVEPGEYEFVCLPLKIAGGDGAPARAILRKQ
jgi:arylformamidase